jgi:hypothetical protein
MSSIVADRIRVLAAFEQPTLSLLHQTHAATVIAVFRSSFSRDAPSSSRASTRQPSCRQAISPGAQRQRRTTDERAAHPCRRPSN